MRRKKSFWLTLSLTALTLCACSKTEEMNHPGLIGNYTSISMKVDNFPSETSLVEENKILHLEAYLFQGEMLQRKLGKLTEGEENTFYLLLRKEETGKIYLLANAENAIETDLTEGETTEESFLKLTSKQDPNSPAAQIMTGNFERVNSKSVESVKLMRNVARIDLALSAKETKIKKISIDNVVQSGYLFPQNPVSTPSNAEKKSMSKIFDSPLQNGQSGIFYFYEQANNELDVTVEISIKEQTKILKAKLPDILKRNTVYTIKVDEIEGDGEDGGGEDIPDVGITIEVSTQISEWGNGGEIQAKPIND